jgi:phosphatidylserine decarboxylase
MSQNDAQNLDGAYKNSFGWLAGYLPQDRGVADIWLKSFMAGLDATAKTGEAPYRHSSVRALAKLINNDGIVRMYVTETIESVQNIPDQVQSIPELLAALDVICETAPQYSSKVHFPMSTLFVQMMATAPGKALFRNAAFNEGLRGVLREWAAYLDSEASAWVLTYDDDGWLGESARKAYNLDDFDVKWGEKHGGFASYNAFFHREIKPGKRPVASPGYENVVVSPNDGHVYRVAKNVQASDVFWIKEKAYSLRDMLDYPDEETLQQYVGGTVVQIFLSGADYHRWHAPVGGLMRWRNVDGLLFSENEDDKFDPDAGVASQVYDAAVNNRLLISIETGNPRLGTVCIMPIGITEISSMTMTVADGTKVEKGGELGMFSYGGSTLCVVFPAKVHSDIGFPAEGSAILANAWLTNVGPC